MFSFSSPVLEGTEAGCGAGDGEAGYDTDEHEFLEEREADKEVTEAGDFLSEELVFCGSDVCTARMAIKPNS